MALSGIPCATKFNTAAAVEEKVKVRMRMRLVLRSCPQIAMTKLLLLDQPRSNTSTTRARQRKRKGKAPNNWSRCSMISKGRKVIEQKKAGGGAQHDVAKGVISLYPAKEVVEEHAENVNVVAKKALGYTGVCIN